MSSVLLSYIVAGSGLENNIEGYVSRSSDTGSGYIVLGHVSGEYRFIATNSSDALAGISQTNETDNGLTKLFGTAIFREPLPDDTAWRLDIGYAEGTNTNDEHIASFRYSPNYAGETVSLDDIFAQANVHSGGSPSSLFIELHLETPRTIEVVAPAFILERVEIEEPGPAITIGNRFPVPEQKNAPVRTSTIENPYVQFEIAVEAGDTFDQNSLNIYLDGDQVVTAGATTSSVVSVDVDLIYDRLARVTVELPIDSEYLLKPQDYLHRMRVSARSTNGAVLENSWTWTWLDQTKPSVTDVSARGANTIRVLFDEPMLQDGSVAAINNLSNYSLAPKPGAPAYPPTVTSIEVVNGGTEAVLTLDQNLTFEGEYELTVAAQVTDVVGNTVLSGDRVRCFVALDASKSECRDIDVYQMLPNLNRVEDVTGDLKKFVGFMQDWADQSFLSVDCFSDLYDVERAPIEFIDAMLFELGNPFGCVDLTDEQKRKLVPVLVSIYQRMGTTVGIESAVRFLTGIDIQVVPMVPRNAWRVGVNHLGVDTFLGPETGSSYYYTFRVVTTQTLTEEQEEQIRCIVEIMKPAHEHVFSVGALAAEPEPVDPFWILEDETNGVLEITTILSE